MAAGLQERERMQRSLSLAREVQQSLLPKSAPTVPHLEISGTSLYCDETGGDFYDYILLKHHEKPLLGTIIGDVSGHGVSAALLMTSIRSLLRARTILPGTPGEIVNHLNQQITRDTEETGQFVTLFYLEIQPDAGALSWVRAGHDPAYLYRSATDTVEALEGRGSALGIRADAVYATASGRAERGDIIVMTTDGIFETRNSGEMFGRKRLIRVVRKNSRLSAVGIRDAIIDAVNNFRGFSPQEDDVTLVVIKFL
jgi:sigma-B regulation protein RsbU (phosphoserine phosphatase)